MKIGILTEIINYHSGARAPLEIAKHLAKRGNKIVIFAYDRSLDEKVMADLKKSNCEIVLIAKPKIFFIGKYAAIPKVVQLIKLYTPQVMYFSGTPPFFLAGKLTGIPIVRMYQGTQFDAYLEKKIPGQTVHIFEQLINKLLNIYIYLVDFMSFRLSTGVVAISKYSSYEGETLYKRKIDGIVYHGTTILPKSKKHASQNGKVYLLSVSRITPYKGFHLIIDAIRAAKTNKEIIFTIAGSQPKENYVSYLKKIGGKNVRIVINPSDKKLAKLYETSDVYVSADRYLYFGLPIVEASQFSKPTISFNFAAANELIVHGKTGYVANNLDEFSFCLQKLIEDTKLRKKLGLYALQRSKAFSWEECADKWEKILYQYAKQPL